jgi:uncharacterized membrane protein YeaQ/YmgE (transglycosylase-associated protein family)
METIGSIIAFAVFGLIVGLIARLLYPGRQAMGFMATMILGMIGSFVGGFIAYLFGADPQDGPFQSAGWIMSIVGAMIVVWLGLFASSRTTHTRPMH